MFKLEARPQASRLWSYGSPVLALAITVVIGVALFALLWLFSARPRPVGQVSALFLLGYGAARFVAEFAREPDNFLGLLALNLSMGQWLSLPMIVVGLVLLLRSRRVA